MSINKQRVLNLLLAFALILSVIAPNIALAIPNNIMGGPGNASITITKLQREPGALPEAAPGTGGTQTPPTDAVGIQGVEFTLTLKETFNPATNEWSTAAPVDPLKGITGVDGRIVFNSSNGLVLGRYDVEETNGPNNIILSPNTFSVDVPMTNAAGNELNYNVQVYPKNEIIRSDVKLTKVGERGIVLPGVKFKLYNENDEIAKDKDGIDIPELTAGSNGEINVGGLAAGRYYFQETASIKTYALNTTKIFFTVKKSTPIGQDISVVWENIDQFATEGKVINYNMPAMTKDVIGSTDIDRDKEFQYSIKIQTPGDIKKYTTFVVEDTLNENLSFVSNNTTAAGVSFSQDGQKLTWTINPAEVDANKEIEIIFTTKIKADAELDENGIGNTAKLKINNGRGQDSTIEANSAIIRPTDGGFRIVKVDKADNSRKLEGAEFKLTTDPEGINIVNALGTTIKIDGVLFTGSLENLATNGNGQISITGLTPRTYYLHETKAPIDVDGKPYRLLTKEIEVVVLDGAEVNDVIVQNARSGWNLPTTDGMGTILFTFLGIAVMAMAIFLFIKGRKAAKN